MVSGCSQVTASKIGRRMTWTQILKSQLMCVSHLLFLIFIGTGVDGDHTSCLISMKGPRHRRKRNGGVSLQGGGPVCLGVCPKFVRLQETKCQQQENKGRSSEANYSCSSPFNASCNTSCTALPMPHLSPLSSPSPSQHIGVLQRRTLLKSFLLQLCGVINKERVALHDGGQYRLQ